MTAARDNGKPGALPAARDLYSIEFQGRYVDQRWETVAWALTRTDADDIAEIRLTKHADTRLARIWFAGRIVAVYDKQCHPGTGRPGVTVMHIRAYLAATGWRQEDGSTWVKDPERITLPADDTDRPRVAKAVEQLVTVEGRAFSSIRRAMLHAAVDA